MTAYMKAIAHLTIASISIACLTTKEKGGGVDFTFKMCLIRTGFLSGALCPPRRPQGVFLGAMSRPSFMALFLLDVYFKTNVVFY